MLYPQKEFIGKNGVRYTLRSPAAEDAGKMLAYLETTAAETEYGLSYPEELGLTVRDEEAFIGRYAADPGSMMISAFDGERLVGNASLSRVSDKRKARHRAEFGLAVLKSDWGQGLGRSLLSGLIAFAGQAGYESVELEVAAVNIPAIDLYRKLGFVVYGERPRSLRLKNGDYYDELLMRLELKK